MADLDDISGQLEDIKSAIEEKGSSWSWVVLVFVFIIASDWIPDWWHSNLRYEYSIQFHPARSSTITDRRIAAS